MCAGNVYNCRVVSNTRWKLHSIIRCSDQTNNVYNDYENLDFLLLFFFPLLIWFVCKVSKWMKSIRLSCECNQIYSIDANIYLTELDIKYLPLESTNLVDYLRIHATKAKHQVLQFCCLILIVAVKLRYDERQHLLNAIQYCSANKENSDN